MIHPLFRIISCFLLTVFFHHSFATDRSDNIIKSIPTERTKIALAIGNGAYKSAPLKNPPNDADIEDEDEVQDYAVDAGMTLRKIKKTDWYGEK